MFYSQGRATVEKGKIIPPIGPLSTDSLPRIQSSFFFVLLAACLCAEAQTSPHTSAALEINASNQGVLLPRMTTAQRDAIAAPAEGLVLYNTTTERLNIYRKASNRWEVLRLSGTPSAVATAVLSFSFPANYLEDSPAFGKLRLVISNNSSLSDLDLRFAPEDISLTGVGGVSISAVNDTYQSIPQGTTHTVEYSLAGSVAGHGTLTATYRFVSLTASVQKSVEANPLIVHGGRNYQAILSSTGSIWLDRNLGASRVAQSRTDHLSFGDLYQWGRAADGHQEISWTDSTTGSPSHGTTAQLSDSPNHSLFITTSTLPYDWRILPDTTLWSGLGAENNPCPPAYRIPTETEFNAERLLFPSRGLAGGYDSRLKLPSTGLRSILDGSVDQINFTVYWVSSAYGRYGRRLQLSIGSDSMRNGNRAIGSAVRCIKD